MIRPAVPQATHRSDGGEGSRYTDPGVDGGAALGSDQYRVQLEPLDLGDGCGEQPDPVDQIDHRIDRELGPSAEAVEQRCQAEALDGAPGCGPGDRCNEHDPIVAQVRFDAAGADDDERAERGIAVDAD